MYVKYATGMFVSLKYVYEKRLYLEKEQTGKKYLPRFSFRESITILPKSSLMAYIPMAHMLTTITIICKEDHSYIVIIICHMFYLHLLQWHYKTCKYIYVNSASIKNDMENVLIVKYKTGLLT